MLLIAAGVVVLLFAARLTAASLGWAFSPFRYLGIPADHASRAWLLAAVVIVLAVLVWLVLRHGEQTLWLPGEAGGVLVPAAALARLAEETACRHPEVVRAEAVLRVGGGAAEVEPAVRDRLARVVGVAPARLVVRPRILTVPQLKRHLP